MDDQPPRRAVAGPAGTATPPRSAGRRRGRRACPGLLAALAAILATHPAQGFFSDGLQGRGYAGSLGAGGATAWERGVFGGSPAGLRPGGSGLYFAYHSPFGLSEVALLEAGAYRDGSRFGTSMVYLETRVLDLYAEQSGEMQVSGRLGAFTIGAGAAIRRARMAGLPEAWFATESLGLNWNPLPGLDVGAMVRNAGAHRWMQREITPVLQFGVRLETSEKAAPSVLPGAGLALDARKAENGPWRVMAAHSAAFGKALRVTAGMASRPFRFSVGLCVRYRALALHWALRSHARLGQTRHYGLAWDRVGKRTERAPSGRGRARPP